jgi:hypothetical protein
MTQMQSVDLPLEINNFDYVRAQEMHVFKARQAWVHLLKSTQNPNDYAAFNSAGIWRNVVMRKVTRDIGEQRH